jgi:hypothetical protein
MKLYTGDGGWDRKKLIDCCKAEMIKEFIDKYICNKLFWFYDLCDDDEMKFFP